MNSFPCLTPARVAGLLFLLLWAPAARAAVEPTTEFSNLVKLAPFVVQGKQLAVSIHARSDRDRHYAEGFAGAVVQDVCASVTPETGKGLIIIGAKGEPHPITFFRKFLALAAAGKLDPAIAARAPELDHLIHHWRDSTDAGRKEGGGESGKDDLEFEKIMTALPLPLEGIGAKLYQLAWAEKFDPARVEARLGALKPADLEGNLFANFHWVFYLPPRNAFDQVLDELVADALKEDDAGFLARLAAKGVMLVVKPKIRHAIEALRQGLLFETIVETRAGVTPAEASTLMGAYVGALFDADGATTGKRHERAVQAVKAAREKSAAPPAEAAAEPAPPEPKG